MSCEYLCTPLPDYPLNNGSFCLGSTTPLTWPTNPAAIGYDVYFGTTNNPSLVSANQPGATYNPGSLALGTYYWKVVTIFPGNIPCPNPVEWTFNVVDNPIPDASSNSPICEGLSLSLFGNNLDPNQTVGNTYLWTGPNSFNSPFQNPIIPIHRLRSAELIPSPLPIRICARQLQLQMLLSIQISRFRWLRDQVFHVWDFVMAMLKLELLTELLHLRIEKRLETTTARMDSLRISYVKEPPLWKLLIITVVYPVLLSTEYWSYQHSTSCRKLYDHSHAIYGLCRKRSFCFNHCIRRSNRLQLVSTCRNVN